jgi:hypothetical protein
MYDSSHARQPTARARGRWQFAAALAMATCWRSLGTASGRRGVPVAVLHRRLAHDLTYTNSRVSRSNESHNQASGCSLADLRPNPAPPRPPGRRPSLP